MQEEIAFKPYDRIIYRYIHNEESRWTCGLFSHMDGASVCLVGGAVLSPGTCWDVLPYVGFEHLVGTTISKAPQLYDQAGRVAMFGTIAELENGEGIRARILRVVDNGIQTLGKEIYPAFIPIHLYNRPGGASKYTHIFVVQDKNIISYQ